MNRFLLGLIIGFTVMSCLLLWVPLVGKLLTSHHQYEEDYCGCVHFPEGD